MPTFAPARTARHPRLRRADDLVSVWPCPCRVDAELAPVWDGGISLLKHMGLDDFDSRQRPRNLFCA